MRNVLVTGVVMLVWAGVCMAGPCSKCRQNVPEGHKFCGNCGTPASTGVTCSKCAKAVAAGHKFCGDCGTAVGGGATTPKPKPKPKPAPKFVTYAGPKDAWDDQAVEKAIARAVKFLWSQQKKDGSWPSDGGYKTGPTGLAIYALLASGEKVANPRMTKALAWLAKHDTNKVYSLGLRCNAWLAAERQAEGKYGGNLLRDGTKLLRSINRRSGGWHYDTTDTKDYHNSTAQYGVLGVWALSRATGEVPMAFWSRVNQYWNRSQQRDGGWGYAHTRESWHGKDGGNLRSSGSMSAAGLASLFICYDAMSVYGSLDCRGGRVPPGIERGLRWFDKEFRNTLTGKTRACTHGGHDAYYLYGVERVGLASGYKYFGTADWFQLGSRHLMKKQKANGAVGQDPKAEIPETAFSVVFWVRGRYPVVMNKLQFDGDWNNRSRDAANFTRWFESRVELPVTWQIASFSSDPWKWLDSSVMYISGSKAPRFTGKQIDMLREYVNRGGTLFSVTECEGKEFSSAMRDVYAKLFPSYKLTPCVTGHDVYSEKVLARVGRQSGYYELSNGIRPLAIHVDDDLPLAWQSYAVGTKKYAFDGAGNIVCYIAGSTSNFRPRNTIPWPVAKSFKAAASVAVTRVSHGGNYDPEPLSLHRFAMMAGPETGVAVKVMAPTAIADLPRSGAKVAVMTGTKFFYLKSGQAAALKQFIGGGGLLVVDAGGGSKAFADSVTKAIEGVFPPASRMTATSLLRIKGFELDKAYYRRRTVLRMNMTSHAFRLRAMSMDGGARIGAILSREDITGGLAGIEAFSVDGYSPKTAYRIMRNAVLYAAGRR